MSSKGAFDFSKLKSRAGSEVPSTKEEELDAVADRHGFKSREGGSERAGDSVSPPATRTMRRRKAAPKDQILVKGDASEIERFRAYCVHHELKYVDAITLLMDGKAPSE